MRQRLHVIVRERDCGAVEGVGLDDVRARFKEGSVDIGDHLGLRQHQKVVVALEVRRPVLEALPAEIRFRQLLLLDHGAHGTVHHQNALGREFVQQFRFVRHDQTSSSDPRMPSI